MSNEYLSIKECCLHYQVEESFLQSLHEHGLLVWDKDSNTPALHHEQLNALEKFRSWHYDLDINIAGLEVIKQLLDKIENLQHTLVSMNQKNLEWYNAPFTDFE